MRTSILAAITATAIAFTTAAHAEQWWVTGATKNSTAAVELDSMTTSSTGMRRVWVATITAKPETNYGLPHSDVHLLRTLYEFDCKERRFRALQTSFLTKELVNRHEQPHKDPTWAYTAPGTTGSAVIEVACRGPEHADLAGPLDSLSKFVDVYFDWLSVQDSASK